MGRQLGEKNPAHRDWAVWAWCLVCAGWLVVIWTWGALHLAMSVDDTYYYFKTALHVSRGVGSSFDGLNPTDGYHPLWLAILALAFKPFTSDMVHLTRVAFTLQVGMVWLGGLLLARLRAAGGSKLLWPLALVLANPFSAKILLCGQETALQFLLSSAALAVWWSLREAPRGYRLIEWAGLAMICSLAALARLDTVFFCAALLAMPLILPSALERKAGAPARVQIAGLGFALFGCGLGSFLLYHLAVFHHLMPVSGAIKQHMDADEIASHAARIAAAAVAVAGIVAFWRAARRQSSPVLALLAPPVVGTLCVAIYNFGLRGEMSPSLIRIWYLEPFLLCGILVVGAVLASGWRARQVAIVLGGGTALWLGVTGLAWRYRLESRSYSVYQSAERCSRWANAHVAPGAVGAAWDAGFAGAFTDRPVINLDGLVNSWEYKEVYFDRGRVDDFIMRRQPVDFVIQYAWPGTIQQIADRFASGRVPAVSEPQTTVTGSHNARNLSGRWGVDLAPFFVAHVECMTVSMAYDPAVTKAPVFYFVLTRAPLTSRMTLAEFARAHASRTSCDGFAFDER